MPHVAREGILQQVLPRAIQSLRLGDARAVDERVPGELVDARIAGAVRVGHEDGDVVAGEPHPMVEQQALCTLAHVAPDAIEQGMRGGEVPADGPDVRLDHAERGFHVPRFAAAGQPHHP
jgi:hypothetical protein